MQFSRYRSAREDAEVNLIPVMNLFVTLIPFLLLAAAFYHAGVIPTSLPSQTDGESDVAADTKSVTVNLVIQQDKILMSASNSAISEETLAALSLTIKRKEEGYDLELLNKALQAIKKRYEDSDTIIVLPGDEVEYQDVVLVLDAARSIPGDKAKQTGADDALFPVVVLSRKV